MQLRPATPQDAEALAGIEFAVAHHAYAELEPRRVALLEPQEVLEAWQHRLDPPDLLTGECLATVAELGGRVVGVAAWLTSRGPQRLPVAGGTLTHLMVHPVAQNSGIGSALLPAAEDVLRPLRGDRHTHQRVQTQVHQDAWWATRFLERRGWSREPDQSADLLPYPVWTKTL